MATTILTRATRGDMPVLLELIREFCTIDDHEYNETQLRICLPPLLDGDDHGVIWMIGEPTVGYAVITWGYSLESGGRDALIDEIYLRTRSAGLGTRALQAIIDNCRARGLKRIFLETEAANARVRTFYTRAGFDAQDSVWMSRSLD